MKGNENRRIGKVIGTAFRITLRILATALVVLLVGGFVFVNILASYLQKNILPQAQVNLENYALDQTSYIYYFDEDEQVQLLQQVYGVTDRKWVPYEQIPKDLIHATVAIEDKRFYEHQGVDWITTAKAGLNLFSGGDATFGGSTLTQQLMKNLFMQTDESANDVTVQRKIIEIFRALAFEKVYSKEVVMEWYLNSIYFGNGCYGVKTAANYYFGKPLQELTTAECAALIGITNNPSLYNPYRTTLDNYRGEQLNGQQRNRLRQESILKAMLDQRWINEDRYRKAMAQQMVFKRDEEADQAGGKTVYCWYVDTVLEDVARALAEQNGIREWNSSIRSHYIALISRAGYHIYTPFDPQAQLAVDNVYKDLTKIPTVRSGQQLQSGIVILDNRTGDVVAMAGGVGEKKDFDAYNRADVPLQIGSSIKPLTVYAPAFDEGLITPATVVDDLPLCISSDGTPFPRNDTRVYQGSRTVWRGIVSSVNAVAVNTLNKLGLRQSFDFAVEELGLTGLTDHLVTSKGQILSDVDYAPLGMGALSKGLTVREVATAYAAFPNNGVWRTGRTFLLVLDSQGNVVLDNRQESRRVMSKKAANYLNYCLDSAVSVGTGRAADLSDALDMDVAGKTGTTAGNKDRYFVGYTGYYTAAVWCGFDTPEEIVLTGNKDNPAARLWKQVMLPLHRGKRTIPLYSKEDMVQVEICLDSGKLATSSCYRDIRTKDGINRVEKVLVYRQDKPQSYCNRHITLEYCSEGHGVANSYCKKFAKQGVVQLENKALVKLTKDRIKQLLSAEGKGLAAHHLQNDYIYLADAKGNALAFFGLHGNINSGLDQPYVGCRIHNQQSWQEYMDSSAPTTVPTTVPSTTGTTPQPTTAPPVTTEPTPTDPPAESLPPEQGPPPSGSEGTAETQPTENTDS